MSQRAGEGSQTKRDRPRILALDGGGVRGWSQIFLLGRLIREIIVAENEAKRKLKITENASKGIYEPVLEDPMPDDADLYPCDYFDLIVGTGTGGVNSVMIGRLGMSILQIKSAYQDLQSQVFQSIKPSSYSYTDVASHNALFDSAKLIKWAKDLAKEYTGDEEAKIMPDKKIDEWGNTNGRGCKICVTSMRSMNLTFPALFRSYLVRANRETNCTIWEAIRATTAAPLHFEPIKIGDIPIAKPTYINAELGANNPINYLWNEFQKEWAPPRGKAYHAPEAGAIVSLGTGKEDVISLKGYQTQDKDAEQKLYNALLRMAKDCEAAHQEFGRGIQERGDERVYFRFNVEQGMQKIADLDWSKSQQVVNQVNQHMDHEEYGPVFEELAEQYLRLEEEEKRKREEDARLREEEAVSQTRTAEAAAIAAAIDKKRALNTWN